MTENHTIVFEHVNCDLCGCGEYTVRYRKPDNWSWLNQFEFPVVECIRCGLVYVNPRPTPESMAYYYPAGYHDNRDTEAFQKRYALQLEFLPALTGEKVLDIGCARGEWLHFLKKNTPASPVTAWTIIREAFYIRTLSSVKSCCRIVILRIPSSTWLPPGR